MPGGTDSPRRRRWRSFWETVACGSAGLVFFGLSVAAGAPDVALEAADWPVCRPAADGDSAEQQHGDDDGDLLHGCVLSTIAERQRILLLLSLDLLHLEPSDLAIAVDRSKLRLIADHQPIEYMTRVFTVVTMFKGSARPDQGAPLVGTLARTGRRLHIRGQCIRREPPPAYSVGAPCSGRRAVTSGLGVEDRWALLGVCARHAITPATPYETCRSPSDSCAATGSLGRCERRVDGCAKRRLVWPR